MGRCLSEVGIASVVGQRASTRTTRARYGCEARASTLAPIKISRSSLPFFEIGEGATRLPLLILLGKSLTASKLVLHEQAGG